MRAIALARRYARALLQSAESQGRMEEIGRELEAFAEALELEPRIRVVLFSPEVEKRRKIDLIERVGRGWASELFLRFLRLLVEGNRESLIPEIRAQYERLLDARLGRVRADTVTAVPLEERDVELLRTRMSEALGADVRLRTKVDPDILGGLVVRVDGKVYDASLRRRLERMREELLSAKLPSEQNAGVQDANTTG